MDPHARVWPPRGGVKDFHTWVWPEIPPAGPYGEIIEGQGQGPGGTSLMSLIFLALLHQPLAFKLRVDFPRPHSGPSVTTKIVKFR